MLRKTAVATQILLLLMTPLVFANDDADREALRLELEQLMETGSLRSSDADIAATGLVMQIYEQRGFMPAWNDQRQIGELVEAIKATTADGLNPSDYHLDRVEFAYTELLAGRLASPDEWAVQDIILTDALARLGYHQYFGKVNPYSLDPNWNFRRDLNDVDPVPAIQNGIDSPSLKDYLATVFPRGWVYKQLQAALADYREIAALGGWPTIPAGATLKPGAVDSRLPLLAKRLMASGDLAPTVVPDEFTSYDEELQQAVRRFQERHGIDVDAVVGPGTLRALNVPVDDRIMQLEINLERARWVLNDIGDDFVLVNIAGFAAYVVRNREMVWETKVQVGSTFHQSPIFRDEIRYLVFNPTWTVPYSIASKEILPRIHADPDYFASRDFDVKTSSGKLVNPSSVDWSQVTRRNFPYWLVQRPGPNNALGRVKFMFPNDHAVYLHDTPSKYLFGRAERAFSHGCIRVDRPFDLAEQLLGPDGWDQQKFQAVLEEGETKTVYLSKPMPVFLLYWTAMVQPDGVHFFNDVYERDGEVADALDAAFRVDLPNR